MYSSQHHQQEITDENNNSSILHYKIGQEKGQLKIELVNNYQPPKGCEVFVGNLPRDCFLEELYPLFKKIGLIYEIRILMQFSGQNRGFAFVKFTNKFDAEKAIEQLNNAKIRGKQIGVVKSKENCKLFISGFPLKLDSLDLFYEFSQFCDGLVKIDVYTKACHKYAFLHFADHNFASQARRKLVPSKLLI